MNYIFYSKYESFIGGVNKIQEKALSSKKNANTASEKMKHLHIFNFIVSKNSKYEKNKSGGYFNKR